MVLSVGSKKYCAQCWVFGKKKVPSVGVFFFWGGGDAPMVVWGGGAPVVAPLGEGVHLWCFSYFQM